MILPGTGLAAATPKKGGTLVYAILGHNSKHKSLKTAKHPYKGIEIRTKNVYNALTWVLILSTRAAAVALPSRATA